MRFAVLPLLLGVTFAACGPEFAVVPPTGLPQEHATQNGVTITAFSNQWAADPDDLADYLTPIAVDLYNGSPNEVRISYADFGLRDETGFRFRTINAFAAATMVGGLPPIPPEHLTLSSAIAPKDSTGELLAFRGGRGFGGRGVYVNRGAARVFVGPHAWGVGSRAWLGFHVHPGFRFYYGAGVPYWGAPLVYPAWYWGSVYRWGPPYYPYQPSHDVLEYALPEGVIAPGGHVNGFLYFQNATTRGEHNLDLAWEVRDNKTEQVIATTHLPLAVVKR